MNPVRPQGVAQGDEARGNLFGGSVGYPVLQQVVVGGVLQPLGAAAALRTGGGAFGGHGADVGVGGAAEGAHSAFRRVRAHLGH